MQITVQDIVQDTAIRCRKQLWMQDTVEVHCGIKNSVGLGTAENTIRNTLRGTERDTGRDTVRDTE